jgi:hypothetical protein
MSPSNPEGTQPDNPVERIVADLERHLRRRVLKLEPMAEGHSGWTYRVQFEGEQGILRLPAAGVRIAGPADVAFVLSDWVYVLDGPAAIRRCQEALAPFFGGDWEDARRTYNIGSADEVTNRLFETARHIDRVDSDVLTPLSGEVQQLEALAEAVAPALRDRA